MRHDSKSCIWHLAFNSTSCRLKLYPPFRPTNNASQHLVNRLRWRDNDCPRVNRNGKLCGELFRTLTLQMCEKLVGLYLIRAPRPDFSGEVDLLVAPPISWEYNALTMFVQDVKLYSDLHYPNLLKCYAFAKFEGDQPFVNHDAVGSNRASHEGFSRFSGRDTSRFATLWEVSCRYQDLHCYARDNRQRSFVIMLDVASAVQNLHANGIAHGKICGLNILVVDGHGILANFLIGRQCNSRSQRLTNIRSTAPEFLAGCGGCSTCASFAADVFQLGLCAIELATGEPAFGMLDDDEVMKILSGRMEYPRPRDMESGVWSELSRLIAHDPTMRPTIGEAVEIFERMVGDEGQ